MQTENGKIEGNITVTGEFYLNGMVTGDIIVQSGGVLRLNGMCCKDVIVEAGGSAFIFGVVSGSVLNRGGALVIRGVISGQLSTLAGETEVASGAIVSGAMA